MQHEGPRRRDGDGDGVPCAALARGATGNPAVNCADPDSQHWLGDVGALRATNIAGATANDSGESLPRLLAWPLHQPLTVLLLL